MSAIGVTPGRVVRSEWIKLTTLRSTVVVHHETVLTPAESAP